MRDVFCYFSSNAFGRASCDTQPVDMKCAREIGDVMSTAVRFTAPLLAQEGSDVTYFSPPFQGGVARSDGVVRFVNYAVETFAEESA